MELKKTHSSTPVGGVEMGSWAERTRGQGAAGGLDRAADCRLGGPTFMCTKTGRNNWGEKETTQPRAPAGNKGEIKPQSL